MSRRPSLPFPVGGEGIRCSPARGMEAVYPPHHLSYHFEVGPGKQAMAHVEDMSGPSAHGVQDLIGAGQCHQGSPGLAATPGGLEPPGDRRTLASISVGGTHPSGAGSP